MALPSYVIGTCFVTAGLAGFAFPTSLYESFGLPLKPKPSSQPAEQPAEDSAEPADAAVSPFLYAKSIRDISCGLTFLLLGATGNTDGVQMLAYTVYLTGAADGWVVWRYGGKELRWKAWVHWIGTVGMAAWFWSTRQKGQ